MSQDAKLESTESNKNSPKQVSRIFHKMPGNVHYHHFLSKKKTLVLLLKQYDLISSANSRKTEAGLMP